MKNTWKERLYDFCASSNWLNGLLLIAVAVFTIISLFPKENDVLTYSIFFLMMATVYWMHFGYAVTHYNKETFLHNKLSVILFANFNFVAIMSAPIFTGILWGVRLWLLPDILSNFWHVLTIILANIIISIVFFKLSKNISEHFKKKIVHVETDEK